MIDLTWILEQGHRLRVSCMKRIKDKKKMKNNHHSILGNYKKISIILVIRNQIINMSILNMNAMISNLRAPFCSIIRN